MSAIDHLTSTKMDLAQHQPIQTEIINIEGDSTMGITDEDESADLAASVGGSTESVSHTLLSVADGNGETGGGQSGQGIAAGAEEGGCCQALLVLLQQPHPGVAPSRPVSRAFMQREGIASVLAVCVLLHRERQPFADGVATTDLVAPSDLASHYRRMNAVGDAGGPKGIGLARDTKGHFLVDRDNRIRAAHYLRGKVATAKVASVIPGMKEGDDLTGWVCAKLGEVPKAMA